MKISEEKFEAMARNSQKLDTVTDYIMERAKADESYASVDIMACMAGIGEEVKEARRAAKEADNGK